MEAEEQGHGIIMGVTDLLILGPFYYIAIICQPKHFRHQCIKKSHIAILFFTPSYDCGLYYVPFFPKTIMSQRD